MSEIDYLIPNDEIFDVVAEYHQRFNKKGLPQNQWVGFIIGTFYDNVAMMKPKGYDFWLQFGGCLPAVERVISAYNGESEAAFYARTQYPKSVVDAYSVMDKNGIYDDFATLIFANQYKEYHLRLVPINTTLWALNYEGDYIDLATFENRLRGV